MKDWHKEVIAGALGGFLTGGNAFLAVMQEVEQFSQITDGQWAQIVMGGIVAAVVAWRTLLIKSPKQ